ncbi:hypothetical protein K432DRAFT_78862 [Lepidopterella palustris CBS 459.81]|uniref:Myb-like domain-containing protein n=1 Tax=Lepidopterella palustris CBS 459.81 TaxID=1314670 RepID=A0A8E2JEH1_9PEZI|nr:hypothetical protein K432DRAFT_78862 [Lepidopterella palustris CBS 459.81]
MSVYRHNYAVSSECVENGYSSPPPQLEEDFKGRGGSRPQTQPDPEIHVTYHGHVQTHSQPDLNNIEYRARASRNLSTRERERERDPRERSPESPPNRRSTRYYREREPRDCPSQNAHDSDELDETSHYSDQEHYTVRPTRSRRSAPQNGHTDYTASRPTAPPASYRPVASDSVRFPSHRTIPRHAVTETDSDEAEAEEEAEQPADFSVTGAESPMFEPEDDQPLRRPGRMSNMNSVPKLKRGETSQLPENNSPAIPTDNATSVAHQLKRKLGLMPGIPGLSGREKYVENDPENHKIKHMRQHLKMSWADISKAMNEDRAKAGRPQSYTEAAVYGRFVRNGKRIAEMMGESFDPKDYMHLKPSEVAKGNPPNVRTMQTDGAKFTPEVDEQLVKAVQATNTKFWTFVADELERTSGRLYAPDKLSERYRKI